MSTPSQYQERWDVYIEAGTKDIAREFLEPRESLSQFVRAAIERELNVRKKRWERREAAA